MTRDALLQNYGGGQAAVAGGGAYPGYSSGAAPQGNGQSYGYQQPY